MIDKKFKIEAKPEVDVTLEEASVEKKIEISNPKIPEQPLTKDDIVQSIERKMVTRKEKREPLVVKIRGAFEKIFGMVDLKW